MDLFAFLGELELFRELDSDARNVIAASSRVLRFRRGAVVFEEGDAADTLYGVVSGRLAIVMGASDGRESMVALMERGDLLGDMGLFDGHGRSAAARALEPSEVIAIPYPSIRSALSERPELLWDVVRMLASRLRSADEALADSVFLDVTGRTAKRLLDLAGEVDEFALPITQEELAGLVGASRERVNKAIAAFIRLGWLEQVGRHYRIADRDQMARRAT